MPLNLNPAKRMMESVMSDTVRVERRKQMGKATFDTDSGTYLEPQPTILYEGSGFLIPITAAFVPRAGEEHVWVQTINLWLPLDSPNILKEDVILCLMSERAPDMADLEWEVDYSEVGSFSVARKVVAHRDMP